MSSRSVVLRCTYTDRFTPWRVSPSSGVEYNLIIGVLLTDRAKLVGDELVCYPLSIKLLEQFDCVMDLSRSRCRNPVLDVVRVRMV
jgi:hypothetical protein